MTFIHTKKCSTVKIKSGEGSKNIKLEKKQGRIRGYPSRVRGGRSSVGEGHLGIWAGAVSSKISKTPKK